MKVKDKFIIAALGLRLLALTAAISLGVSCSNDSPDESAPENGHAEHEETEERFVLLSEAQLEEFDIEIATAGSGKLSIFRKLSGEIVIDPDRLAHIFPRFPGIVKEVRKRIGNPVKRGEVLAIIESNESLSLYELKSLIDGTVIEMHLTRGEVVSDESHDLVVADLSHVWVNLNVYQKDLPYVRLGQRATISAGEGIARATGKISYISPVVSEATRTAIARVVLPNRDGRWRPGLFVTGDVEVNSVEADIAVPKTAVEIIDDQRVVFVQTEEGFKARPVSLGRSSNSHVEILSGLSTGQRFVARGGFTLKAELAKGSFESGHAH